MSEEKRTPVTVDIDNISSSTVSVATCVYCGKIVRFDRVHQVHLAECPYCHKISVLGEEGRDHFKRKGVIYYSIGAVIFALEIGLMVQLYLADIAPLGSPLFNLLFSISCVGLYFLVKGSNIRAIKMSPARHGVPVLLESGGGETSGAPSLTRKDDINVGVVTVNL